MNVPATKDMIQEAEGNLEVPEIRVWCHPHWIDKSELDYFEEFNSFQVALNFIQEHTEAERMPLVAFRGYELNLWGIKEKKE